ncbi:MAG: hypothetical protein GF411_00915 [Candidatus Lokiarchaeota archaeon]|nr:hypothetical protein [Candidatus Lokiarchaeota archaeon]
MKVPDFTIVCGVDKKHLEQLELVWPTWKKNKPSLLNHPMVIFYDASDFNRCRQVCYSDIIDHPNLTYTIWPPEHVYYPGDPNDKWTNPQRYKMLAGFVYVSRLIETPYMLKLDTDVVASGFDEWIDPGWFEDEPAIVSHRWNFTKPRDQMLTLDRWASDCRDNLPEFENTNPLNLKPHPDKDRLGHKRIISWCSFWNVSFVRMCSSMAGRTCGSYRMPVPSQDGFLWYCAKRLNKGIVRTNMKGRGWQQWMTMRNIRNHVEGAMR